MALRHQIIAALWAAGGLFTLILCWMIYTTDPFHLPPLQVLGAIAVTSCFWWLVGSLLGRSVERRVQARLHALRQQTAVGKQLRHTLDQQQIVLERFAADALPLSRALAADATAMGSHTLALGTARAGLVSEQLLATTDELGEEIERMGNDARAQADRAEQLQFELERLGAQQPQLAEQLQALTQLAKQFDLLALNASIEGSRVLDRTRGVGLLVQEMADLGSRAEHTANRLSEDIGQLSDGTAHSQSSVEPLVSGARLLADSADMLALLTDEQWAEIEKLRNGELASNDSTAPRLALMDSAQRLAEKSSQLRQTIESLLKTLQASAA